MSADVAVELARLGEEVEACTRCDLYCTANRGVPGEGPSNAVVMLVGEGPGMNEDKQGRPFVGAAGKFLEQLLWVAGLRRSDVYITNVVKHRPPNNRDPELVELLACRPYLERQIALIRPRVIVTLGRYSLGTFFPGNKISQVHGQIREKDGVFFFNMYHPAAALHQERLKQTLLDDMKKLDQFMRSDRFRERTDAAAPEVETDPARESEPDETPPEQLTLF